MVRIAGIMSKILFSLATILLLSCGSSRSFRANDPHWRDNDSKNIADPGKRGPLLVWETIDRTLFEQTEQFFEFRRTFHKLSGHPEQAHNINSFDEVPNSSWYTNRHAYNKMSAEELRRGVAVGEGPDTSGLWTVWRSKVQGMTPGLFIMDERGDRYILKFDPKSHPDLATSAAAISSRFFHAVGYNVPQETIVYWRPEKLRIKDGLMFEDRKGNRRPFSQQDLTDLFERINFEPDGSIRSLASKFLPDIRGPFSFDGRRKNDPNDWCDHEHRRELRALYVFCSLVNHFDIKDQNTMDVYADENGRRFLKHYLLDFGSTLGSAGHGPMNPRSGYANQFDLKDAFISLITLGLKKWQWEDAKPYKYASVGYFESEIFHPAKWDPIYPIPAFEEMTNRDAYWAAKQVMALRDSDIRALVEAGKIRDKEAEAFLIKTLIERRDKIGKHWFSKVNSLDYFKVSDEDNGLTIGFEDLALHYGLDDNRPEYYFAVLYRGKSVIESRRSDSTRFLLSSDDLKTIASLYKESDGMEGMERELFQIDIKTIRNAQISKSVLLWLWYRPDTERFKLVGVEHLD